MKQPGRGYEVLVALPLAFVTIFCFMFVMLHPYYKPQTATSRSVAVSVHGTAASSATTTVDVSQPPSHLAIVPVPVVASSTPSSLVPGAPTAKISTNAQQSSSSSTKSLQDATSTSG